MLTRWRQPLLPLARICIAGPERHTGLRGAKQLLLEDTSRL